MLPGLCPKENVLTSHGKIRSWSLAYQKCSGRSVEDPGWLAQAIGRKAFPRRFRGVLIAPEFAVPSFTHSCVIRKCNLHKAYKGKRRRVKHSLTILAASPRHSPFTQAVSCMGKGYCRTCTNGVSCVGHSRDFCTGLVVRPLPFFTFQSFQNRASELYRPHSEGKKCQLMGHTTVTLRCDNEPVLVQVLRITVNVRLAMG